MNPNLFGEYAACANDIAKSLISSSTQEYRLSHVEGTKSGFTLSLDEGVLAEMQCGQHNSKGFYAIWRDGKCLYVGETGRSIGTRLSRFVKEVYKNSRRDENHPAAAKYRTMWGSNLDGVTVTVYPMKPQPNIDYKDVEKYMIMMLKPLLNKK